MEIINANFETKEKYLRELDNSEKDKHYQLCSKKHEKKLTCSNSAFFCLSRNVYVHRAIPICICVKDFSFSLLLCFMF